MRYNNGFSLLSALVILTIVSSSFMLLIERNRKLRETIKYQDLKIEGEEILEDVRLLLVNPETCMRNFQALELNANIDSQTPTLIDRDNKIIMRTGQIIGNYKVKSINFKRPPYNTVPITGGDSYHRRLDYNIDRDQYAIKERTVVLNASLTITLDRLKTRFQNANAEPRIEIPLQMQYLQYAFDKDPESWQENVLINCHAMMKPSNDSIIDSACNQMNGTYESALNFCGQRIFDNMPDYKLRAKFNLMPYTGIVGVRRFQAYNSSSLCYRDQKKMLANNGGFSSFCGVPELLGCLAKNHKINSFLYYNEMFPTNTSQEDCLQHDGADENFYSVTENDIGFNEYLNAFCSTAPILDSPDLSESFPYIPDAGETNSEILSGIDSSTSYSNTNNSIDHFFGDLLGIGVSFDVGSCSVTFGGAEKTIFSQNLACGPVPTHRRFMGGIYKGEGSYAIGHFLFKDLRRDKVGWRWKCLQEACVPVIGCRCIIPGYCVDKTSSNHLQNIANCRIPLSLIHKFP